MSDAQALLLLQHQREADDKKKADLEDDSKWQYYIRCYRCDENGRHHIGAFLTGNPKGGTLGQNDFFTSYKNRSDPWQGDLLCQVCYNADENGDPRGEEFQLKVNYEPSNKKRGVRFAVIPDYLWRYAKDPELAKTPHGRPHRAVRVAYRSGNEQFAPLPNERGAING